jgi:protein-arginine kinase activator protein McsA
MKLMTLRKQLDDAVGAEDYERAAKLRDKMNQLQ